MNKKVLSGLVIMFIFVSFVSSADYLDLKEFMLKQGITITDTVGKSIEELVVGAQFFTMIHNDGTIERIALLEEVTTLNPGESLNLSSTNLDFAKDVMGVSNIEVGDVVLNQTTTSQEAGTLTSNNNTISSDDDDDLVIDASQGGGDVIIRLG